MSAIYEYEIENRSKLQFELQLGATSAKLGTGGGHEYGFCS